MSNSPEEAWLQGRSAGAAGGSEATNPFSAETDLAMDWLDGWREGSRERYRPLPSEEEAGEAVFFGSDGDARSTGPQGQ